MTESLKVQLHLIARIHGGALDRSTRVTKEQDSTNHVLFPLFQLDQPYHELLHRNYVLPATLEVVYSGKAPSRDDFYSSASAFLAGPQGIAGYQLDPGDIMADVGSYWDGRRWRVYPDRGLVHGFLLKPNGSNTPLKKVLAVAEPANSLVLDFVLVLQAA